MADKVTRMTAIKTFFENDGRKVTTAELKALTPDDRTELAELCAKALHVELEAKAA